MPMQPAFRRLFGLALLASLGTALGMSCACRAEPAAEPAEARLRGELDRLEGVLKRLEAASRGSLSKPVDGLRQQLAGARQARSPSVLAYQLRRPFVGTEALAFGWEHREAGKDLGRLEALWQERGRRFKAAARPVPEAPLLAALTQAAENRAEKLYRAALPYGRVDSPESGLYYLGEAEAQMSFRDFVSSLSLPAGDEKALDAAALQAALESLEGEALAGFAADPAAQSLNGVSARLKEARELFERGSREGAALALLESRMEISRLRKAGGSPGGSAAPSPQVSEGGLLTPFVALPEAGGSGVVPLYRSLFRSRPPSAAGTKAVTVTLVRWPYT